MKPLVLTLAPRGSKLLLTYDARNRVTYQEVVSEAELLRRAVANVTSYLLGQMDCRPRWRRWLMRTAPGALQVVVTEMVYDVFHQREVLW